MRLPTAKDIKDSGVLGKYFFSKDTMGFFNQPIRSFKTEWHDRQKGIVRLHAPIKDGSGVTVGTTERFLRVEMGAIKLLSKWDSVFS